MITTYRGKQIKVVELLSGALSISIDGRTIQGITAIFATRAIELARAWIDQKEQTP
jgi:hypothetical protein